MKNKPKVILFDIETSLMINYTFTLWPDNIGTNNIHQDWFVISACWKELGKKKVHSISINDFKRKSATDDSVVVKTLRDALSEADIVIGHNSDKFDIKKLNTRLMVNRLQPLEKVIQIDTLKEIKKIASFSSNRLDYLCQVLLGVGKAKTSEGLWVRATNGDKASVNEMVKYNKVDVVRLEELYLIMKPYMKSHPHVGAMQDKDRHTTCPSCGGNSFDKSHDKIRYTAAGVKKLQRQCADCHKYSTFTICKPNAPFAEKVAKRKLKRTRSR